MKITAVLLLFLALLPARGQEDASALIKKGDVFDRKIKPAEALELYLAAEKLKPDNVPLMLRIARQYRHRAAAKVLYGEIPEGSSEEAVVCFQKAIKLNPNRLSHYVELGLAYAALGKNAEARECLEKGLSMPAVDAGDPVSKRRAREALPKIE